MAIFRRVKIRATVETAAMLLAEEQIDGAIGDLRDKLEHLDLAILSVEAKEAASIGSPKSAEEDDPWSFRGHAVE